MTKTERIFPRLSTDRQYLETGMIRSNWNPRCAVLLDRLDPMWGNAIATDAIDTLRMFDLTHCDDHDMGFIAELLRVPGVKTQLQCRNAPLLVSLKKIAKQAHQQIADYTILEFRNALTYGGGAGRARTPEEYERKVVLKLLRLIPILYRAEDPSLTWGVWLSQEERDRVLALEERLKTSTETMDALTNTLIALEEAGRIDAVKQILHERWWNQGLRKEILNARTQLQPASVHMRMLALLCRCDAARAQSILRQEDIADFVVVLDVTRKLSKDDTRMTLLECLLDIEPIAVELFPVLVIKEP